MRRNTELIRQWTLLQRLATRRTNTLPALAADLGVSTRTIRRDLVALQAAGFPIYDDTADEGKTWRLDARKLAEALPRSALTVPELCALYCSRALFRAVTGSHFFADLQSALDKFEAALPAAMKRFLDRLPLTIAAKAAHGRRASPHERDVTTKLFEAALGQQVVSMHYYSQDSQREKEYVIHPYRLVYAQNALYLQAYVPDYAELRTFLVDRIRRLSVQLRTFERVAELSSDPFGKSMGVYTGPTCTVRLRFHPRIASIVRERTWHSSQQLKERADASLVMTLQVCDDYALRQWVLGFGRYVRVLAPAALAEWVLEELDGAREQYVSGELAGVLDEDVQPALPFLFSRLGGESPNPPA
ncbi:MAG: hypothetical protein A3F70_17195 [Acidobacteria bacterium RIFCSPLOWO2_12_FULL_67_14]|nr:MAG: hypothetical protein A3H29_04875 [Acidobacteria bacterium RIFCSPLOWO2_02_FULL_67_21]OFW35916.1 MAG: hypothetical protein A3F70_17195 [Acidobacteria bacterium RIFCSPLOWO2_12_FULL_67_14]